MSPHAMPRIGSLYRLQHEATQQAWVLLYPEGMVRLNGPAAEVLQRCDGRRTVAELVDELERQFDAPGVRADVCEFLCDAHGRGWIV